MLAAEDYVLERVVRLLREDRSTVDATDLARQIMGSIQSGDDIANGLRAISISALDELGAFLKRNAHSLS